MESATFLLCAESGYFETQTLLAVECLRRFGGKYADQPVLVVTPRLGPSLVPATLKQFERLGVRYVRKDFQNKYAWYPYTNKALAASVADDIAETEQIFWLDSDVLVVSEPTQLSLASDEDFAICSVDKNVGSSGPEDPYEAYWAGMAKVFGMSVDDLPWVRPEADTKLVRFRLHSGVYSFKRGLGLGEAFVSAMNAMMASGIVFSKAIPYPGDDVALAFALVKLGLRFRMLPMTCNQEIIPDSKIYRPREVKQSSVLHYHHALTDAAQTPWLLAELSRERPDVANWLKSKLPLDPRVGGMWRRAVRRLLAETRRRAANKNQALCQVMVSDA